MNINKAVSPRNPLTGDIPLANAMIAWNDPPPMGDGRIAVVPWPDDAELADRLKLTKTTGACWTAWEGTPLEMKYKLLREVWLLIRQGFPAEPLHNALCFIPEYRELLNECLLLDYAPYGRDGLTDRTR